VSVGVTYPVELGGSLFGEDRSHLLSSRGSPCLRSDLLFLVFSQEDGQDSDKDIDNPQDGQDRDDDDQNGSGADATPDARLKRYCTELEQTAVWGGELELRALSNALNRRIRVFSADMDVLEIGAEHLGMLHVVPLFFCISVLE
jgi:OTU-like cysteine protease